MDGIVFAVSDTDSYMCTPEFWLEGDQDDFDYEYYDELEEVKKKLGKDGFIERSLVVIERNYPGPGRMTNRYMPTNEVVSLYELPVCNTANVLMTQVVHAQLSKIQFVDRELNDKDMYVLALAQAGVIISHKFSHKSLESIKNMTLRALFESHFGLYNVDVIQVFRDRIAAWKGGRVKFLKDGFEAFVSLLALYIDPTGEQLELYVVPPTVVQVMDSFYGCDLLATIDTATKIVIEESDAVEEVDSAVREGFGVLASYAIPRLLGLIPKPKKSLSYLATILSVENIAANVREKFHAGQFECRDLDDLTVAKIFLIMLAIVQGPTRNYVAANTMLESLSYGLYVMPMKRLPPEKSLEFSGFIEGVSCVFSGLNVTLLPENVSFECRLLFGLGMSLYEDVVELEQHVERLWFLNMPYYHESSESRALCALLARGIGEYMDVNGIADSLYGCFMSWYAIDLEYSRSIEPVSVVDYTDELTHIPSTFGLNYGFDCRVAWRTLIDNRIIYNVSTTIEKDFDCVCDQVHFYCFTLRFCCANNYYTYTCHSPTNISLERWYAVIGGALTDLHQAMKLLDCFALQ